MFCYKPAVEKPIGGSKWQKECEAQATMQQNESSMKERNSQSILSKLERDLTEGEEEKNPLC